MKKAMYDFFNWLVEDLLKKFFTDIQSRNLSFCLKCFGLSNTYNKRERAFRYAEESMELLQAAGLTESEVACILRHVYGKPAGSLRKELANAQLTLLALGTSYGIHVQDEAERDLDWAKENMNFIQKKYLEKPDEIIGDKLGILLKVATVKAQS